MNGPGSGKIAKDRLKAEGSSVVHNLSKAVGEWPCNHVYSDLPLAFSRTPPPPHSAAGSSTSAVSLSNPSQYRARPSVPQYISRALRRAMISGVTVSLMAAPLN